MRIGYFITHFPYKGHFADPEFFKRCPYGGGEIVAYNLAVSMARRGHEVAVFTTSADHRDFIERFDGITVHHYGTNFRLEKGFFSFNLFRKPLVQEVDVVHAHLTVPPGEVAALFYAKTKKKPLVVTYHGDPDVRYGKLNRRIIVSVYNKFMLNKVLSGASIIVSPSKRYIDESRFLPQYKDKLVTIPNGINVEEFNIPYSKAECRTKLGWATDDNIILFVGNLIQYKGPHILIRAMPGVIERIPKTRLIMVGSGNMRDELEKLSKKLELSKYVEFAGFVGGNLKSLYYKTADIFVLPSIMGPENSPVAILEAMASGLPTVASKISGIPDTVNDGETGSLIPPGDSEALADAVVHLLRDPNLRSRMADSAKKKLDNYSWEKIAKESEKLYKSLTSAQNSREVLNA
jgi:glycosyltransferase involved in cell wall biosynthesis